MNREQAKELLPIIQAFAEGRTIELKDSYGKWVKSDLLAFNSSPKNYRIKREPKYRSFKDAVECWQEMLRHEPFGWVKTDEGYEQIRHVNKGDDFNATLKTSTFADGTPFGINEEE